MSVHQLPDGRWIVKARAGTWPLQPRKTKEYCGRGSEGERRAKGLNLELGVGLPAKAVSTPIFSDLAADYMAAKGPGMREQSRRTAQNRFKTSILPLIGELQAHEIDHKVLDAFIDHHRQRGKKNSTINTFLVCIFATLNHAAKRGAIIANPVSGYRKLTADYARIRPPSKPEFDAILAHALPHIQRVMLIAYYTGMRPGRVEMYGLRWDDVDFYGRVIMVASARKGGMPTRDVPIADKLFDRLVEWKAADDLVRMPWIIHWGKKRLHIIEGAWESAKKKAGVTRRLRLYDLRHMSATAMLSAGASLKAVSQILGHSTPAITTSVYEHVIDAQRIDAISRL